MSTLLERLPIEKNSTIVDIGAGSRKELLALSRIVGEDGIVLGVEHSERLVKRIRAGVHNNVNVRVYLGEAGQVPLLENSMDVVLFKGVLHEINDVPSALLESKRVCKNDGRVLVDDFSSFPVSWLKRSNLRSLVRHPRRLLGQPLDVHPGFSEATIRLYLRNATFVVERYDESFELGSFSGHPIPLFLAVARVTK